MGQVGIAQLKTAGGKINQRHEWDSGRTYLAYFTHDCDETYVKNNIVIVAGGNPIRINDLHPTDSQLVISAISYKIGQETGISESDSNGAPTYQWIIDVEYGPYDRLEMSLSGSMTDIIPRFFWDPEVVEIPAYTTSNLDSSGKPYPIVTSSYEYYDPGIMRKSYVRKLVVRRNEALLSINWTTLSTWEGHVNADTFLSYPARTCYLNPVRMPDPKYCQITGSYYCPMEYVFDIRIDTHDVKVIDQGYKQLTTTTDGTTVQEDILVEGVNANSPVLLNGSGEPLTLPPSDTNPIVVNVYQIYPTLDYSVLKMDSVLELGGSGA